MPTHSGTSWHYSAQEVRDNLESGVQNILKVLSLASDHEYQTGKDWYPKARRDADKIASLYSITQDTAIWTATAMSPRCPWERNFDSAEWVIRQYQAGCWVPEYQDYLDGKVYLARVPKVDPSKAILAEDPRVKAPPFGGLKMGVIKALWVLQGHTECVKGPKVNPFFWCIKDWENYLGACVDSHAIQVWFYAFEGGTYGVPDNLHHLIIADYVHAASLVGLSPLQLQAITWLVKKRVSKERGLGGR